MLLLAGIILGVHYGAQRVWYTNSLKDAYRFEEEKLRARNKSKSQVLEFPAQRATGNPESQVAAEEAPPEAAPDAQQI
jgi:hypothetical protein